ncbi:MAG: hypothetical protein JSS83_26075 [Cyanobacteria bacterium SZAS LIN-3]|nr:hypothetical protein [Cyanobacteria bacterium SZAS LIN-3]
MDMPAEIDQAQAQTAASVKRLEEKSTTSNARFALTIFVCLSAIPIILNVDSRTRGLMLMEVMAWVQIFATNCIPLAIFAVVLTQILKATGSKAPALVNDPSLYRRFVRPVGRIIVWSPGAAIITFIIVGAGLAIVSTGFIGIGLAAAILTISLLTYEKNKTIRPKTYDGDSDMDGYASKRI